MLLLFPLVFACADKGDDSQAPIQTVDDSAPPAPTVVDDDGDGYEPGADCNDADVAVHPDAVEVCNGVDDDCDGQIDDAAIDFTTYYRDGDGDGFGLAGHTHAWCEAPTGYVDNDDDCDDNDASVSWHSVWYVDLDGDGYGTDVAVATGCVEVPGFVQLHGDCDDVRTDTYPAAPELCDVYDNDCDGALDEDPADPPIWYEDLDGDQWGDLSKPTYACNAPLTGILVGFDCDDTDPAIHPLAPETCGDGLDVDCSGRPSNGCSTATLADAAWIWAGTTGDYFGHQVARAGDIDGDGKDDVLAGAYYWGSYNGVAYLVSGNTNPETYDDVELAAEARFVGDGTYDYLGYELQWAGDIDDDGFDDIMIGSLAWDDAVCDSCGVNSFFFGPLSGGYEQDDADAWVPASSTYADLGTTATAGDFDNDGYDDVIVGSIESAAVPGTTNTYNGSLLFIRGPISGEIDPRTHATATFQGDANDYAASGVTTLRDADGDGLTDFAVGARYHLGRGAVYFYQGPISGSMTPETADVTYAGRAANDYFGYKVEWAGDMDGDGTLDLAATALDADDGGSDVGAVYVLYGPHTESIDMSEAQAWFYGNTSGAAFGYGLAEGADLDGDGFDDLFMGDYSESPITDDEGGMYVFYGPALGPRVARAADLAFIGTESNSYAGYDLDTLDFDGDGAPDLLVGAYRVSDYDGRAYVIANTSF